MEARENLRGSGILLSISSLPSPYGIGTLGREAYNFVDLLGDLKQKYWQVLPVGPTIFGDSPYQPSSGCAGNIYFIDLDKLVDEGLLEKEEILGYNWGTDESEIDYAALHQNRCKILQKAFERFDTNAQDFQDFVKKQSEWLEQYALFMTLKTDNLYKNWSEWPSEYRNPQTVALEKYQKKNYNTITFWKFCQYKFFEQWEDLKNYANSKGIYIIGDISFYVGYDSVDVWAHPELFQLDEENVPTAVAGCPPDGFSATGQLWGNPLYRWDYHRETGYAWWISRLHYVFQMYDVVRIDHFRGFDEYFSIPHGAENAIGGHWEKGPGIDLFRKVEQALGWKQVIAEDLGYVTDSVREMVRESGFPGMKVLEFAFDSRDSGCANDYLPHNYPVNSVAYTGTHDNETIVGWWSSITKEEQKLARDYMCDQYTPESELYKSLISLIMRSSAKLCVVPMQDYLGLGNNCRMNTPSTVGKNWKWRVNSRQLSLKLQKEIQEMTLRYGRMNWETVE